MNKIAQNEIDKKITTSADGKTTKEVARGTIRGAINVGGKMKRKVGPHGEYFKHKQAIQLDTPEGKRYYEGKGKSSGYNMAMTKSRMNALQKYMHTPADSLTTQDYNKKYGK